MASANTSSNLGQIPLDVGKKIADVIGGYEIPDSTLGQSDYDFSYRTFPKDLATDYNGHYMIININVPVRALGGAARGAFGSSGAYQNVLSQEYSKVDTLRFGQIPAPPGAPQALNAPAFSIGRYTKRIKESIALYMPAGMIFNSQNKYEEISLTALGGKIGSAALTAVGAGAATAFSAALGTSLGKNIPNVVNAAGSVISQGASIAGYPINPRVEVLYSSTDLRQFRFEVLMAPRDETESIAIKEIVRTLRFHSAPELDPATSGFTFIPPAEFDITFYNRGEENTNIPRINTCVLNLIEVDYAPQGPYATFSNGHPVAVRMTLGFTEVEALHKIRVLQGF